MGRTGGKKTGGLSQQQQRAVDGYVEHGIAKRALLEAGYSEDTARTQTGRFFRQKRVAAALQKRLDEAMTAREVLHRLGKHAREGEPGISVKALELLGKKHKLFTDKVEVGGDGGGPINIRIVRDGV